MNSVSDRLVAAAVRLRHDVDDLRFSAPVTHVYNPLDYAWDVHCDYISNYGRNRKRVVFLGMNPGPFGMAQTGVPFGEVAAVTSWLKIGGTVRQPESEHPKRPVDGFSCARSEVSGRRLWGLFRARFVTAVRFFEEHYVVNYCPLAFLEDSGRNRTPNKLPVHETAPVYAACDRHLQAVIDILEPEWVVGIGVFAEKRLRRVTVSRSQNVGKMLHPSPASPKANRDWSGQAEKQLIDQGIWG